MGEPPLTHPMSPMLLPLALHPPPAPQTALHWAAKHGKEDMATMLVGAGADINMRAVSGVRGVPGWGWPRGGGTPMQRVLTVLTVPLLPCPGRAASST